MDRTTEATGDSEMISRSDSRDVSFAEPITVLLVDDDETWIRTQRRLLERGGDALRVTAATSFAEARTILRSMAPDCVVCDHQLGDGTGIQLLTAVREQTPSLPFILVTGEGDEGVASDAISQGVTDYVRKADLGDDPTRLSRRVETVVSTARTQQALDRERRSKEALLQLVTSGSTRAEVGRHLCTQLVSEQGYACAWVGILDDGQGVVPLSTAGTTAYIEAAITPGTQPSECTEPTFVALCEDEPVVRSLTTSPSVTDAGHTPPPERLLGDAQWITHARRYGFETAAAVPIRHDETTFGVLSAYGRGATPIDDRERSLLEEYAETLGYVFHTAAWKRTLLSSATTTVRFRFGDDRLPLVALSSVLPTEATMRTRTVIPRNSTTVLYLMTVDGATKDDLTDAVEHVEAIRSVDVYRTDGEIRCGLIVEPPVPERCLPDGDTEFAHTVVEDGRVDLTAVLGDQTTVEECVDRFTAVTGCTPTATLCADPAGSTTTESEPIDRLTDRQRQVLELATSAGYFERPRHNNTGALAEMLDITRSTFTQHLRAAQRKMFEHRAGGNRP